MTCLHIINMLKKCEFYSELAEYFLFSSSLTMSNEKVKIIQDWLELKKIQSFLGFANSTINLSLTTQILLFH